MSLLQRLQQFTPSTQVNGEKPLSFAIFPRMAPASGARSAGRGREAGSGCRCLKLFVHCTAQWAGHEVKRLHSKLKKCHVRSRRYTDEPTDAWVEPGSATLGSPCQQSMEIKRGSTANESISLPRESATGHCGRKLQLRRRDVRTAVICKAMLKTRTSLVRRSSRRSTALFRLEAVDLRVRDQNRCGVLQHLRSAIPSGTLL
jgi:hypothetical protein